MGMSGQRHALAALQPLRKDPGICWIGGWVGLRAGLDTEARWKVLCLCRESNSGRQMLSQTLLTELPQLQHYHIKGYLFFWAYCSHWFLICWTCVRVNLQASCNIWSVRLSISVFPILKKSLYYQQCLVQWSSWYESWGDISGGLYDWSTFHTHDMRMVFHLCVSSYVSSKYMSDWSSSHMQCTGRVCLLYVSSCVLSV
jgi:hypothetical protein